MTNEEAFRQNVEVYSRRASIEIDPIKLDELISNAGLDHMLGSRKTALFVVIIMWLKVNYPTMPVDNRKGIGWLAALCVYEESYGHPEYASMTQAYEVRTAGDAHHYAKGWLQYVSPVMEMLVARRIVERATPTMQNIIMSALGHR